MFMTQLLVKHKYLFLLIWVKCWKGGPVQGMSNWEQGLLMDSWYIKKIYLRLQAIRALIGYLWLQEQ